MSESITLPVVSTATRHPIGSDRLQAVDLLRGLVMVLMALDHTRDYFHFGALHGFDPLDFKTTTAPLFLTRWITHFCAPVFVFLAGTGAFLSAARGKSKRQLSWFLVTRGGWLIFLELTLIHWAGWAFAIDLHHYVGMVIWAIGWSMVVLAALIHLPLWGITAIGLGLIVGHNAVDAIKPGAWGAFAWLWRILHAGGGIEFAPGYFLHIAYPLIPWIGVMATGYAFGRLLQREREARRRVAFRLGAALTVGFLMLRGINFYGDPRPWVTQNSPGSTVLAFLDCHKYPPSLSYLLMTLGPALIVLAFLDTNRPGWLKPVEVFGRVPLFYYLLHLPLIHGLALLVESLRFGHAPWLVGNPFGVENRGLPADAGLGLVGVYLAWFAAILLLYPVCVWFAEVKRRRRNAWLSYF